MWSKIVPVCLCLMLLHGDFVIHGQEPMCNQFSFQEQLLDKMVRMEVKVETMFASILKTQSDIKEVSLKVERELNSLANERDSLEKDIAAYKVDANKKLLDVAKGVERSVTDFENKIVRFSSDIHDFKNHTVDVLRNKSSVTYVRWGRTICPDRSKALYEGFAGGSHYSHKGGPSHTVCLPREPQFGKTYSGGDGAYIYNAEYAESSRSQTIFGQNMDYEDVPCVVCEATRKSSVLMIPARQECYEGWDVEYGGYLMTSHYNHQRADLKCVDAHPEKVPGQSGSNPGDYFYFVEATGTIPDPPYTRGSELTCVVCTT